MNKVIFKIVVNKDGKDTLTRELSYDELNSIISAAQDIEDNQELFRLAACHSAGIVRENVAYKEKLSEDTVLLLSKDKNIQVLRNLVRTEKFKEIATIEELERLMALDTDIAQTIANDTAVFPEVDQNKIIDLILKVNDPSILGCLAGSWTTPKKILKELAKHSDLYVSSEAKRRLSN